MSWQFVALSKVSNVFNGKTPSKLEQRDVGHPVLKIKDVDETGVFTGDFQSFVDFDLAEKFENKKLELDDTLILNAAHNSDYVGSKQYRAEPKVVGSLPTGEWLIARANQEYLDPRFLNYWFASPQARFQIKQLVKGIHLYPKDVSRLEIPLPPLPEQKRIAAILDKADAIRRKRQQAIQLADEFLRSVFLDMFGDPVTNPKGWGAVKLGDICEVGSSKRVFVDEFTEFGIPFYRGTEVGRLGENEDIQPHLYISNDHYENLKKHSGVPKIGDLLLPSICHDGRIWKVNSKTPFYFKDGRVLWIKVNQSSINSDYLRSYLKNLFLANYSSIASGTTFAELKIVILKELSVLSPPLDLQIKYAEIIEKAIKKYGINKAFSEKSSKLFDSLCQKAFAGEL
ncbi:restriction endonuclease subunit S [Methylotuvimicrobium sp. KM2]|uniref:restriction endonuclease subunit S n=1 Tax=Methylotuvimicrobium sp. KM2 TaxID=3133976 RepID=UPI003101369A